MSLTSATKATSFKDQLSEFVMKQENGQEKDQHVNLKFVSLTLFNNVPEEVFVIFILIIHSDTSLFLVIDSVEIPYKMWLLYIIRSNGFNRSLYKQQVLIFLEHDTQPYIKPPFWQKDFSFVQKHLTSVI